MTESASEWHLLELDGTFDTTQVERILHVIDAAPGLLITLDFKNVTRIHDSALVLLARALVDRKASASFLGLSRHGITSGSFVTRGSRSEAPRGVER